MKRMTGWLMLTLAVVGAGCLFFTANDHELEPDQVALRSECITHEALFWRFDADDTEGQPLEAVFYTLQCTPQRADNEVDIVVRLYDSPAEGRSQLRRTDDHGGKSAVFQLTYRFSDGTASGTTYRVSFCGRDLGTWKTGADKTLAAILPSLQP